MKNKKLKSALKTLKQKKIKAANAKLDAVTKRIDALKTAKPETNKEEVMACSDEVANVYKLNETGWWLLRINWTRKLGS